MFKLERGEQMKEKERSDITMEQVMSARKRWVGDFASWQVDE